MINENRQSILPAVECPRCLGKGYVDREDIKRLKKELVWRPGPCAYCNASGKVARETLSNISPDNAYLTIDLPEEERIQLLNGDEHALKRAYQAETAPNSFIQQVEYLYNIARLSKEQIIDFYMIAQPHIPDAEKEELSVYIEGIILKKSGR